MFGFRARSTPRIVIANVSSTTRWCSGRGLTSQSMSVVYDTCSAATRVASLKSTRNDRLAEELELELELEL